MPASVRMHAYVRGDAWHIRGDARHIRADAIFTVGSDGKNLSAGKDASVG
jgi:hypothetical protein